MKVLRLLQIGDIHYPQAVGSLISDHKNGGISSEFVAKISPHPLQMVCRKLATLASAGDIRGVLLCGDLTSFGCIASYKKCAEFMSDVLGLTNPGQWQENQIHLVPGNHDVDWALCDTSGADIWGKFRPLCKIWSDIGLPILPVPDVRQARIEHDGAAAEVFSVNSCLGCGEKRYLPEPIRDELYALIRRHTKSGDSESDWRIRLRISEQLDTPAFSQEHLEQLVSAIDSLEGNILPVVLSHHNVLPQAIPRVALYTEILNSGLARTSLAGCKRPVLYLHGHVHDDPAEIIQLAERNLGPLISISAPELIGGFNLLEIHFGTRGSPIGCRSIPYRIERGVLKPLAERSIQIRRSDQFEALGDQRIAEVMAHVPRGWEYFVPIQNAINMGREHKMQKQTVGDVLREAEWFGLVEIQHRNDTHEMWQVKRAIP
jgi:hypothetical protein